MSRAYLLVKKGEERDTGVVAYWPRPLPRWLLRFWLWLRGNEAQALILFRSAATFHYIDVPVINGVATLPDGRTVESTANIVRVPVLDGPLDPFHD